MERTQACFPETLLTFFAELITAPFLSYCCSTAGMSELVKERPANPIEYLASYLLRHDPARAGTPKN